MFSPLFVFPDLFAFKWFNFIDHLNSRGNFAQGRKLINLWQKPYWCFIQFYSPLLLEPIQRSLRKFIFWRWYEWVPFGKYIKNASYRKQFSLANWVLLKDCWFQNMMESFQCWVIVWILWDRRLVTNHQATDYISFY